MSFLLIYDPKSDIFDTLIYVSRKANINTIPSSVKFINDYDFESNMSAVSIFIPENVERIGKYCFKNCSKLHNVEFDKNSKIRKIKDQTFMNSSIDHFNLPSFMTKIGTNAFLECKKLRYFNVPSNSELKINKRDIVTGTQVKSFWIPPHVTYIHDFAFQNRELQIIQFDDNSELEIIQINPYCIKNKTLIMISINLIDRIRFEPIKRSHCF